MCLVIISHNTTTATPVYRPLFQNNLGKLVGYKKGETSLDLNEAKDDGGFGWQWHQHLCKQSAPRFRQLTTPTPHHSTPSLPFLPPNRQST